MSTSTFNFSSLYNQFDAILAQMPDHFTSHEFILRLARENQALYIEALYFYRNTPDPTKSTPFQIVHGVLAQRLHKFPHLIQHAGTVPSVDIFGQTNACESWKRI